MKLKKIVFETSTEEIHLDIEDAKTLYKQLDEIFGKHLSTFGPYIY